MVAFQSPLVLLLPRDAEHLRKLLGGKPYVLRRGAKRQTLFDNMRVLVSQLIGKETDELYRAAPDSDELISR